MTEGSDGVARFAPSLAGLAVLSMFAVLWIAGEHASYYQLLTLWGIVPFRLPFLDIDGPLSALECSRRGLDVILANPCDIQLRPYNYSPVLLDLDWIPLGGGDRVWAGLSIDLAFLVSLSVLPAPLSKSETGLRIIASVSTMIVFAVERANMDVLVFVFVIVTLDLVRRSLPIKAFGYGVAFTAGVIKYYPFVLLGLAMKERPRAWGFIGFASITGLFLLSHFYGEQILRTLNLVPHNTAFGDTFGAINLLLGVFEIELQYAGSSVEAVKSALAILVPLLVFLLWVMVKLWRGSNIPAAIRRLDEKRRLALLAGILLVVGCFFTGQNVGYRGIYLLLILPALSALAKDEAAGKVVLVAQLALIGVPVLMWAEAIRLWLHLAVTGQYPSPGFIAVHVLDKPLDLVAWGVREVAWWVLALFLSILLLGFLVDTATAKLGMFKLSARSSSG